MKSIPGWTPSPLHIIERQEKGQMSCKVGSQEPDCPVASVWLLISSFVSNSPSWRQ